ncbi:MAG: hypothetical protein CMP10_00440 [Zetaproteobacteria bacterium]|nr:hypothetical protein [Pseudobdellovibrionaceae bacterium]|tara:strand:- start:3291 stop:4859 length:1569 start_codon:yes stop_codon:yes gene_type:complete
MSAIVTDQFRILNANNFVDSVESDENAYYVFIGLPNPDIQGFGRSSSWKTNTPDPVDSFSRLAHVGDTMMFGKKISSKNIRRIIKRVNWTAGSRYEMYRDDYSSENPSPIESASRLYGAKYYVMNEDYRVYICISNGSTGDRTSQTAKGNISQDEPTFTDLEPSRAGNSGDGYIWKYLFTVSPSDIIKFDSTEYITVPNSWTTTADAQIRSVRENGNSLVNNNQIKHVYIENGGGGYAEGLGQEVSIIGDGTGAKARVDVVSGTITNVTVSAGGQGYSYALVDLGSISNNVPANNRAKLVPIIPPALGHGSDIYKELGTDKVLIYARFDDSTKDFPTDTKFSQIGIVKNPTTVGTANTYTTNDFSSLQALKLSTITGTPTIGEKIVQTTQTNQIAEGYIASWDKKTQVLKYFRDRSLNYTTTNDQTDYAGISTSGRIYEFESTANVILGEVSNFSANIDTGFSGISTNPTGTKLINLGTTFKNGLSDSEINKGSGDIIYLDNRPLIARNERQKEDVKIILEF